MTLPPRLVDPFWEIDILFWFIVVIIFYWLGLFFLRKFMRGSRESRAIDFALTQLFFAFGTARLIENIRSFYIAFVYSIGADDIYFLNFHITGINLVMRVLYYAICWSTFAILFYIVEKHILKELGYNTRYLVTIGAIIEGFISISIYFNMLFLMILDDAIFVLVMGTFILFFIILTFRSEGKLRRSFALCTLGIFLSVFGVMINLPEAYYSFYAAIEPIEPVIYLINPFFLIFGGILIAFGFQLELFKWQQKLQHLFVIMSGGICIYDYNFILQELDQDLVTGALTGVIQVIQEVTKKDSNLKVIQQENAVILLEYGKKFTFALLANEDLLVLRNKLEFFAKEFETFFEALLPNYKDADYYKETSLLGNILVKKSFTK